MELDHTVLHGQTAETWAHEPNHGHVKVRTVVLKHQHGRAHVAASAIFERGEKQK